VLAGGNRLRYKKNTDCWWQPGWPCLKHCDSVFCALFVCALRALRSRPFPTSGWAEIIVSI
jgi:hypothetical protein